MTHKELTKLVRFARKQGLKFLKCGEVEFEFSNPSQVRVRAQKGTAGEPLKSDEKMPTDDEMLFRSSPYYDELLNQRENSAKEQN